MVYRDVQDQTCRLWCQYSEYGSDHLFIELSSDHNIKVLYMVVKTGCSAGIFPLHQSFHSNMHYFFMLVFHSIPVIKGLVPYMLLYSVKPGNNMGHM